MPLIDWKDDFNVGVPALDGQHKRLVGMLNDLSDAMADGKPANTLGSILTRLTTHAKHHFSDEERLMAQCGYPELDTHKAIHSQISAEAADFLGKLESGDAQINAQVTGFLEKLLSNHILNVDQLYSLCLTRPARALAVSLTDI